MKGSWIDSPVDATGEKFTQLEPQSLTVEEGEFLYALVRMGKPQRCLEIGTGRAVSTRNIARGLKENREGRLDTCETSRTLIAEAIEKLKGLPVEVHQQAGLDFLAGLGPEARFDFLLLDGGLPSERMVMLRRLLADDRIAPGGLLVIHDALNPNDGDYRPLVEEVRAQKGWPGFVFHSLAGIAVFQRLEPTRP